MVEDEKMMNFWFIFGLFVCLIVLFFTWALCRISAMSDARFAEDEFFRQCHPDPEDGEE